MLALALGLSDVQLPSVGHCLIGTFGDTILSEVAFVH